MDPRQQPPPQLPFSRNAASPFGRPNFPPTQSSSQQSYSNAAPHPSSNPPYSDLHSRKPSDPTPYYPQSRQYPPEPGSIPPPTHSRHQSTSSITSGPPMNRGMPPPSSPPQQHPPQGNGPGAHQIGGPYGLPPPRPLPVSVGPPTAFPRGRELPALESLPRTNTSGSSMSISSMLGGPPPAREPPPPAQYAPAPPPPNVSDPPSYSQPVHASPRMHSAGPPEYQYRRPQTPERHRIYDARDSRANNTVPSPSGAYATPEVQRYGTPQAYPPRGPPMTATDQAREQARMGPVAPPRPNSQPKAFPSVPPRSMEMNRPPTDMYGHREEMRHSGEYNPERPIRIIKFEDRFMMDRIDREREERERHERDRQERDRQERERQAREIELRERERREISMSGGEGKPHSLAEYARVMEMQRAQHYGMPPHPDPREQPPAPAPAPPPQQQQQQQPQGQPQPQWSRPGYDPARPGAYDPATHPRHPEYPPASGPHYSGHPAYGPPVVDRPPPSYNPHQVPHQHNIPPPSAGHGPQYDSPDRPRINTMPHDRREPLPQAPLPRTREEVPVVPPPSLAYGPAPGMYGSPRNRSMDDIATPHNNQRSSNLLNIQEINRKGRISPLPQAVQGAQPQLTGPAGEPGIKSEFGRMFSGIGTGVGNMSSPVPLGAQLPYVGASLMRREDSDGAHQEPPASEPLTKAGQRGKRRKNKDDDGRGDEESTGRLTPVGGRIKKAKTHSHHHHHHHHHPHHHNLEQSPAISGSTPFKSVKGGTPIPSPTAGSSKDFPMTHHHSVPRSAPASKAPPAPPTPPPIIIPKPRRVIKSKAVLDSVADRPRHYLGDVLYKSKLKPARLHDVRSGRGFRSTPIPLPWSLIEGKENCTLTMKIGKEHLTRESREEITYRRALWGTDVYTDDSDVIAACIHAGWIRGEWSEDVDVDLLGLEEDYHVSDVNLPEDVGINGIPTSHEGAHEVVLTAPPKNGPMEVPENQALHVTLLILPKLQKYVSTIRFGIKSREFGGLIGDGEESRQRAVHDGISFMIIGVRWVTNGGAPQDRLRGKARRERIYKALRESESGPAWAGGRRNVLEVRENGVQKAGEKTTGGISGGWWDKENLVNNGKTSDVNGKAPEEGEKSGETNSSSGTVGEEAAGEPRESEVEDEVKKQVKQEMEKETENGLTEKEALLVESAGAV